jgi:hypothetical protein
MPIECFLLYCEAPTDRNENMTDNNIGLDFLQPVMMLWDGKHKDCIVLGITKRSNSAVKMGTYPRADRPNRVHMQHICRVFAYPYGPQSRYTQSPTPICCFCICLSPAINLCMNGNFPRPWMAVLVRWWMKWLSSGFSGCCVCTRRQANGLGVSFINELQRVSSCFSNEFKGGGRSINTAFRQRLLRYLTGYVKDSAVGVATGYGLKGQGLRVRVPTWLSIFTSPYRPRKLWGPPSLLYNGYRVFPRRKAAGSWSWPLTTN